MLPTSFLSLSLFQYASWSRSFEEANLALEDRQTKVNEVAEHIEKVQRSEYYVTPVTCVLLLLAEHAGAFINIVYIWF